MADVQQTRRRALFFHHVAAHGLAIDHNTVHHAIGETDQATKAGVERAMGPLAGEHKRNAERSGYGNAEAGQRKVESMDKLDSIPAEIAAQNPRAARRAEVQKRPDRQAQDRHAVAPKLAGANPLILEAPNVNREFRRIKSKRQLSHLAFTAAGAQISG